MSTFLATAKKGKLDFGSNFNESRFNQFLKDNDGKEIRITKLTRKRTNSQNALYWKYLEIIEKETGNNANDLHEYFRRALLSPKFVKVMGKDIKLPHSTTELNKVEFSDYMDKISAESGVPVLDTETYNKYYESAPLA